MEGGVYMSYCDWAAGSDMLKAYHDKEWGVPTHDDKTMFRHLMMEAMQCGLSWSLILKKQHIFDACFDGFDYEKIARYTEEDVERIMNTEGMIRSVGKIRAVINNANCFIALREEYGSFCRYIWGFTGGKTLLYEGHAQGLIPVSNGLSHRIAADLRKRGFKYLGDVTLYSHLQACGIINDHHISCPCYKAINKVHPTAAMPADEEQGVKQY